MTCKDLQSSRTCSKVYIRFVRCPSVQHSIALLPAHLSSSKMILARISLEMIFLKMVSAKLGHLVFANLIGHFYGHSVSPPLIPILATSDKQVIHHLAECNSLTSTLLFFTPNHNSFSYLSLYFPTRTNQAEKAWVP